MIDHLNYDINDEGQHTRLAISPENLIDAPIIVGSKKDAKGLLYQGTGILADPENPLVLPLLTADSTAYSYVPDQTIKEVFILPVFFKRLFKFNFSIPMLLVKTPFWWQVFKPVITPVLFSAVHFHSFPTNFSRHQLRDHE